MKRKLRNICAVAVLGAALASCTQVQPYAVSNATLGSKQGVSETIVLFGTIYLNGNYGLGEAAKKGKLTGGIATVDVETTTHPLAFLFYKKKLIVSGN